MANKGIVLGIGIVALGAGLLLVGRTKPAVKIGLRNPPIVATIWSLFLTDWNSSVALHPVGGLQDIPLTDSYNFQVPNGTVFPLRVASLQIAHWSADQTAIIVDYEMQSFRPFLWDFDTWDWDGPDPSYREAYIPDYGTYYYNVETEQFEA